MEASLNRINLLQLSLVFFCIIAVVNQSNAATEKSFALFESGHVRPLALSSSGETLYAVNTPDNRLEIFTVTNKGLSHTKSVPVGLEPVAIALRNDNEIWVVNHLSDSISIVSLKSGEERVIRTLLVGDEPSDIVFAGKSNNRAFITTAHRGQNVPYDPEFTKPGIGRADVWVFDAKKLGSTLEGKPLTIVTLFTDSPRALAVADGGKTVYAAGFKTGTQTTVVWGAKVKKMGGLPKPNKNASGEDQPLTALIVKWNGKHWIDEAGRHFDQHVKFSLPDKDVFKINATANPPALAKGESEISGVGSVLFNMITNPVNGKVYVTNLDSKNEKRFEGPGKHAGHTGRGQFVENRISIIDGGKVIHRPLNKHVDFSKCCQPIPNKENSLSLAMPLEMAITKNGNTLYVAAYSSQKIGVYDTKELENNTFKASSKNLIAVSGGGPSGLVLDEKRNRLYAITRFNNSISVIDTKVKSEVSQIAMFNPEPTSVVNGRRFNYDAVYTSSHGTTSCASCHIFGDNDQLAWDLGNPDSNNAPMVGLFKNTAEKIGLKNYKTRIAALKGPMTTQSMRGLANHGAMHWRGDRSAASNDLSKNAQPDGGQFSEEVAFKAFNVAFAGLVGRDKVLTDEEMDAYTKFALQIMYPPNPIRSLDNSLTPDEEAGFKIYTGGIGCIACHTLDRTANFEYNVAKPGFFGTKGLYNVGRGSTQALKIPHLRNMYTKIGMFGAPDLKRFLPNIVNGKKNPHMGEQIRGFGFIHDGTTDTVFMRQRTKGRVFRKPGAKSITDKGQPHGFAKNRAIGDKQRRQVEAFVLAYDSNLFPVVGQQITLTKTNARKVGKRIDLLIQQADLRRCDLVAKIGNNTGYLYLGAGKFKSSKASAPLITDKVIRQMANKPKNEITYTCVPPGSGMRIALDRDENGVLDGDESTASQLQGTGITTM